MVCMRTKPGVWSHGGRCRSTSRERGDTLKTSDHTAFQVHINRYGRVGIGWSSWKGLNTGRHDKVPVRCPCSRWATLHVAPRTRCCRCGARNYTDGLGELPRS